MTKTSKATKATKAGPKPVKAKESKTATPARAARPAKAKASKASKASKAAKAPKPAPVALLSGGNPQIAKGEGDAPVQAYIAAMPEWKRAIGERLDALITRTVRGVHKAVKWNTPFYGVDGQTWFVAFHVFEKYVKVTFCRGTSLDPVPPEPSKVEGTRYVHVREDGLDEAQLRRWIRQAAALPGDKL